MDLHSGVSGTIKTLIVNHSERDNGINGATKGARGRLEVAVIHRYIKSNHTVGRARSGTNLVVGGAGNSSTNASAQALDGSLSDAFLEYS